MKLNPVNGSVSCGIHTSGGGCVGPAAGDDDLTHLMRLGSVFWPVVRH
jgi:hypothetical protein